MRKLTKTVTAVSMTSDHLNNSPQPTAVCAERLDLAREATYQGEVLIDLLLEKINSPQWDLDSVPALLATTLCVRMKELNGTAMSALDDDAFPIEQLRLAVMGHRKPGAMLVAIGEAQ